MIVDSAHYVRGSRQNHDPLPVAEAAALPRSGSSWVWLELDDPEPDELAEIARGFGLHELAVEDAGRSHQRPKVETYGDFIFLVFRTARYDEEHRRVEPGELDLFLGRGFVIAVRYGRAGEVAAVRERLEERPQLLKSGPAAAVWGILDAIVDEFQPVVDGLERDIDDVERIIFTDREDATERIYFLKQEVDATFRAVHPLITPLAELERGAFGEMDPKLLKYFRDVGDHVRRVDEEVNAQREQLTSALDANVSLMTVRQNTATRQLNIVATIFLPLSFVVGFFGQNFAWLVDHVDTLPAFLGYGIGGIVVSGLLLAAWLWRSETV